MPVTARFSRTDRVILGAGAALAVTAPLVLALHARTRCEVDLSGKLSALAGVTSRIGDVDAGLTGTVRLSDVAIGELFAARAIEARVALPSLLAGRLTADEVQVEAPALRAHVVNGDVDLVRVMRRIAARRPAEPASPGDPGSRSVRRIVVTEGDLVITVDGAGTISASGVELHPQPGGVRVVSTAVRIRGETHGVAADLGFARAAADVALPAVKLERLVATGGAATAHGPDGPALALGAATLTYDAAPADDRTPHDSPRLVAPGALALVRGSVDDAGVPRPFQLAIARDAFALEVDHVPLAAAGPWLPGGIVALDGARLTGTIDAARAAGGGLAIAVRGELTGVAVRAAALADRPVPFDVGGSIEASWRAGVLDADARLASGKARLTATAHLDRGASGWDRGALTLTIPPTPCLDLLDAVPRALRGASAGLTVDGTAQARIELGLDGTADPGSGDAVRLAAAIDVGGCRVLAEAPRGDPAALRAARDHVFPDGSHRTVGPDRPDWVALADLPGHVAGAFVAAEDARFWSHRGFDVDQIGRSLEVDLRERRLARGGSTISQQLVKNVFLGPERTFARKLEEAILTWRLEATTSKRDILEHYLNVIELGPGVFGLDAAAAHWFGTSAARLTTRQAAFLAALTPEPRSMSARIAANGGALDPRSRDRVDVVLRAMKRAGVIDAGRLATARDADLGLRRRAP
jgi:hypothetical protein